MTLRALIESCLPNESVNFFRWYSSSNFKVLNLHVKNPDDYCRFALGKYFKSELFNSDLSNCSLDMEDLIYRGVNQFAIIILKDNISYGIEVCSIDEDEEDNNSF